VRKIQDTNVICPPVISQHAALGALQAGPGYCLEKLRAIAAVRHLALRELATIADICAVPPVTGAFYFLLRLATPLPALELVERLVREHRVAAIPASAFGVDDACALRISYGALEEETAAEGLGRLVHGLRAIVAG
jgi:aspartate/methionine/tyrosine aminotransferase